jgi:hypothetical protein
MLTGFSLTQELSFRPTTANVSEILARLPKQTGRPSSLKHGRQPKLDQENVVYAMMWNMLSQDKLLPHYSIEYLEFIVSFWLEYWLGFGRCKVSNRRVLSRNCRIFAGVKK